MSINDLQREVKKNHLEYSLKKYNVKKFSDILKKSNEILFDDPKQPMNVYLKTKED